MEAKENNLADTPARQAAKSSQIIQIQECFFSLLNRYKTFFYSPKVDLQKKKEGMATKIGETSTQASRYGLDLIRKQFYL